MRIIPMTIVLFLLAGCGRETETPLEVRDFVQRRADCRHWAGEEGYDAARRAEIGAAYAKLRCAALAADEAALKARYADHASARQALDAKPPD